MKSEGVGILSECTVQGMCVSSGAHCKTGMLVNVFFVCVFFLVCEIQECTEMQFNLIG